MSLPLASSTPRTKAAVRYGFRGSWAGFFVGAIGCAVTIVVGFFTGLISGSSVSVLGLVLDMTSDGGFDLAFDIRPITYAAIAGTAVGAAVGILLALRPRRHS